MSRVDDAARPKAVVVEDDLEVAELLALILAQSGFDPVVVHDGPAGVAAVREHRPAITTVDVALPGLDGLAVTRQVRQFSSTYVLMVSALAGEDDILGGFAAGADDYVAKPFRPRELRSRLLAGLRRPQQRYSAPLAAPPVATPPDTTGGVGFEGEWVTFRGLRLNPAQAVLTVDGLPVVLNRLEFDLLELLLYAGPRVRSAGDLALSLRGEVYPEGSLVRDSDRHVVIAAMAGLMEKLGEHGTRWIEAVDDTYRLAPSS
jgi:two-component system OmpR family response regulator